MTGSRLGPHARARLALLPVCVALPSLTAAATWSLRLGLADYYIRQRNVAAAERAIRLAPDNAAYAAQISLLTQDDDPPAAKAALQRAVFLNPWDARSWIDLGLRAETGGDALAAKQCLLHAAGVDKRYQPRWTLANYSFRQDDEDQFWYWAKEAVGMASEDVEPLFRLCGRISEDGLLINRLGIRSPDLHTAYLWHLIGSRRPDLYEAAIRQVLENRRDADAPVLLAACESMLGAGLVDESVALWRRLEAGGRAPPRVIGAQGEQLLVNPRFETPPISRGFDWILPHAEGISASQEGDPLGLRLTLSGSEPEISETLAQLVPVVGGQSYELSFAYRTSGIAANTGLAWRVATSAGIILKEGPSLASESDSEARLQFENPADSRLIRLSLWYRRAPGTTRLEGCIILRRATLRPLAHTPAGGSRVRK